VAEATSKEIRRAMRAAVHEVWCGTPPSCGLAPASVKCAGSANERELTAIIAALREDYVVTPR